MANRKPAPAAIRIENDYAFDWLPVDPAEADKRRIIDMYRKHHEPDPQWPHLSRATADDIRRRQREPMFIHVDFGTYPPPTRVS